MTVLVTHVSLLLVFVVPSLIFFLLGPGGDLGGHFWLFVILGVILFIPLIYVVGGWGAGMEEIGHAFLDVGAAYCTVETSGCMLKGDEALTAFVSIGLLIYWIDYVAGIHMHNLFFDEDD